MLAWAQMHNYHIGNNENNANEMINQLNNWANNMNDNDIIRGREIIQLLNAMNTTVNTVRNTYENQMNIMRQHMQNHIDDLNREIGYLRDEITRLNNVVYQQGDGGVHAPVPPPPVPPPPAPPPPAPPPPVPQYTKEELCAELLESIENTKEQMQDQTYRTLTDKLMGNI